MVRKGQLYWDYVSAENSVGFHNPAKALDTLTSSITLSQDAINAALYPDETFVAENYLYFCATSPESTELHFSRTLQEHEQAVAIYAPLWQQYDKERGIE